MNATGEQVFVTTGLAYRHNQNYHLLPWNSHDAHNNIGRMTSMGRLRREIDFGILSINNPIDNPMPDVGGPVFSYDVNITTGDLGTSRADLKGIITGTTGELAFVTKIERIRAEANINIFTSLGLR
ncbi:3340_t:CDS:2 [Racocetra fulgida]|uniref:3340_t:CDS:1 n=1 Tax=Racocetra fulgida TaxID=60492 RepID=A0A9N9DZB8_9GLOM|nr:3340_t:CDS:2 [Racocetra fulgida]